LLEYACTQPVPFADVDALKSWASTSRSEGVKKKRSLHQILEVLQRSDCTSFAEINKKFDSWELRQILSATGNPAAKSATKASCVESVVALYRDGALQSLLGTSFSAFDIPASTEGLLSTETQSQHPCRNVSLLYTATSTSAVPPAPGVVFPSSATPWQPMEDGSGVVPKPFPEFSINVTSNLVGGLENLLEQTFHAMPTTAPSEFFLAPTRLSDWTPCSDSKVPRTPLYRYHYNCCRTFAGLQDTLERVLGPTQAAREALKSGRTGEHSALPC
jgi:hypothetical protein